MYCMTFKRTCFSFALAISAASAIAATPVGTLQSDGRFQVIAAGKDEPVAINQSEYTFFSGDTIIAGRADAVLNLNAGGGIGFPKGARVTVIEADSGAIEAEIAKGAVLYAFPEGRENFVFHVGNFTVQGQAPDVRSMQVSREGEIVDSSVGTIERLADGNIKASVRSGALNIRNGDSVRYQVSAGESVGLLDMPNKTIRTQSGISDPRKPLVLIQSPERVGTNEDFLIRWEAAEPAQGDYVVIAKSGAEPDEFESLVNSDEGNELAFEAPGSPGDYEIRFIDGQTGEIKRFVYLDVIQDVAGAYWWDSRVVGALLGVTAGATGVYIVSERDGNGRERPVSP